MTDVTGRDDYIIAKALAYAITAIEVLPFRDSEWSDQQDMKKLFDHIVTGDGERARLIEDARRKLAPDDRH